MKLFKKIRKGFTLIELVVVIAVIAILSAVAVVSYISITNKAKQSSDEQAVRQMNTALKASSILGVSDITELYNVLAEEGMDAENYKPLAKDTYFFWDQAKNQIVYAKYDSKASAYVGIYPESYKGVSSKNQNWFSLSKEIKKVSVSVSNTGSYDNIKTAEELYTILDDKDTYHATSITLKEDINLMGADVTFKGVAEFDGGGKTLSNLSQLDNEGFDKSQKEDTNSGLFGEIIGKGGDSVVKIENVTIENSVVGSADTKFCGILGGKINSANVVVNNVTIKDCTVYSLQKGGILFGYVTKGSTKSEDANYVPGAPASSVTIGSDVNITGCKVATLLGEGGKLIGAAEKGTSITNNMDMSKFDVTLESIKADNQVSIDIKSAREETMNDVGIASGKLIYNQSDAKNYAEKTVDGKKVPDFDKQEKFIFRFFNKDAMFTVVAGGSASYNGTTYTASADGKDVSLEGTGLALTSTITKAVTKSTIPVVL